MDLHKGRGSGRSWGTVILAYLLASFLGHPVSERSQGRRRHLASARLFRAARQAAGWLRGGWAGCSAPQCQIWELSAQCPRPHLVLQLWAAPVGWGKARSSAPDCKLTFPHCCCWQNTYTNADKLLEAAEQLAQTGECDPEEIYKAARHLEVRIQDFVRRVEQRKLLLDMSVSFHTHTKEVRGLAGLLCSGKGQVGFLTPTPHRPRVLVGLGVTSLLRLMLLAICSW